MSLHDFILKTPIYLSDREEKESFRPVGISEEEIGNVRYGSWASWSNDKGNARVHVSHFARPHLHPNVELSRNEINASIEDMKIQEISIEKDLQELPALCTRREVRLVVVLLSMSLNCWTDRIVIVLP